MLPFGALWPFVRFENAHLIKAPQVTDLVELLMTATVHTGTIGVQSYPDGNKSQNL